MASRHELFAELGFDEQRPLRGFHEFGVMFRRGIPVFEVEAQSEQCAARGLDVGRRGQERQGLFVVASRAARVAAIRFERSERQPRRSARRALANRVREAAVLLEETRERELRAPGLGRRGLCSPLEVLDDFLEVAVALACELRQTLDGKWGGGLRQDDRGIAGNERIGRRRLRWRIAARRVHAFMRGRPNRLRLRFASAACRAEVGPSLRRACRNHRRDGEQQGRGEEQAAHGRIVEHSRRLSIVACSIDLPGVAGDRLQRNVVTAASRVNARPTMAVKIAIPRAR